MGGPGPRKRPKPQTARVPPNPPTPGRSRGHLGRAWTIDRGSVGPLAGSVASSRPPTPPRDLGRKVVPGPPSTGEEEKTVGQFNCPCGQEPPDSSDKVLAKHKLLAARRRGRQGGSGEPHLVLCSTAAGARRLWRHSAQTWPARLVRAGRRGRKRLRRAKVHHANRTSASVKQRGCSGKGIGGTCGRSGGSGPLGDDDVGLRIK
eukprot:16440411-Heterocapsa_arctica.AAC.2